MQIYGKNTEITAKTFELNPDSQKNTFGFLDFRDRETAQPQFTRINLQYREFFLLKALLPVFYGYRLS